MLKLIFAAAIALVPLSGGEAQPPPHLRIDAQLGPGPDAIAADVQISLSRERAGREYRFLLARSVNVTEARSDAAEVRVENVEQPFPNALQAIIVTPRQGTGPITIHVRYQGRLATMQRPPINSINAALTELSVDSLWLPFPQEFNVGITADARLRGIPRGAMVVSTGTVRRQGDIVRVRLDRANDLALIASPALREVRDGRMAYYGADLESPLARVYRAHGRTGLQFLESLFGTLPGGTSRVVMVRRESPAGYSRPDYMVVADRPTPPPEIRLALSLVHEIAHGWWSKGNFLNEDYWLVEGTAQYYMLRYGEATFGAEAMQPIVEEELVRARRSGAITGRGRPPSDAAYARSAMVLRALEAELGRARFDRFMRDFSDAATHTTAGFLAMLTSHSEQATADRFGERLRAASFEG